jgi:hypothetical protein
MCLTAALFCSPWSLSASAAAGIAGEAIPAPVISAPRPSS